MLKAYEAKHGPVFINQGARTIAEQTVFWLHFLRFGSPRAARPFPGAPHIKGGANNHAMDINAPQPVSSVAAFYRAHGVSVAFNVPGEPWHMDTLSSAQLAAAARKLRGTARVLRLGSKGDDVKELQKDLRAVGRWGNSKGFRGRDRKVGSTFGPATRTALKGYQRSQKLKADGVYGPTTRKHLEADAKRARK